MFFALLCGKFPWTNRIKVAPSSRSFPPPSSPLRPPSASRCCTSTSFTRLALTRLRRQMAGRLGVRRFLSHNVSRAPCIVRRRCFFVRSHRVVDNTRTSRLRSWKLALCLQFKGRSTLKFHSRLQLQELEAVVVGSNWRTNVFKAITCTNEERLVDSARLACELQRVAS